MPVLKLPPLGPSAPLVGRRKAQVVPFSRFEKTPVASAIRKGVNVMSSAAMPAMAMSISSLGYAMPLGKRKKEHTPSSQSGGGGSGSTKFIPKWNWEFGGGYAPFNLLANAEMLKPIGRPFTPDPDYKGNGECPPQLNGLSCAVDFSNVVEMNKYRAEYRKRTMHSIRQRKAKEAALSEEIPEVTVPPGRVEAVVALTGATAANDSMDTVTIRQWDPIDARSYKPLTDMEESVERSMFDKAFHWYEDNDGPVSHALAAREMTKMQEMFYFTQHLMTQFSEEGGVKLAPSVVAESTDDGGVRAIYHHIDGYDLVVRMTEEEFYYRVDVSNLMEEDFIWVDGSVHCFNEEVAYDLMWFDRVYECGEYAYWMPETASLAGFYTYRGSEMEKYFDHFALWEQSREEGAAVTPKPLERLRWEIEYEEVALLRDQHRQLIAEHIVKYGNLEPKARGYQQELEDTRYERYWLMDDERRLEYSLSLYGEGEIHTVIGVPGIRDGVTMHRGIVVPPYANDLPAMEEGLVSTPGIWERFKNRSQSLWKEISRRANGLVPPKEKVQQEAVQELVEGVLDIPEPEKVEASSDAILLQFLKNQQTLTDHEAERFTLWLDPETDNKGLDVTDYVAAAIRQVMQEEATEEISEGGIFLGKIPPRFQVTESGLMIIENMTPPVVPGFDSQLVYRQLWQNSRKA